jgi:hypothetical protein
MLELLMNEALPGVYERTAGNMAVKLAGDMGEVALDLAQFRARQVAARDEAKETKKGQNAIEKAVTHSKKRDT